MHLENAGDGGYSSIVEIVSRLGREVSRRTDAATLLDSVAETLGESLPAEGVGVVFFGDPDVAGGAPLVASRGDLTREEVERAAERFFDGSDVSQGTRIFLERAPGGGPGPVAGDRTVWVQPLGSGEALRGALVVSLAHTATSRDPVLQMVTVVARIIDVGLELRHGLVSAKKAERWMHRLLDNMPDPAVLFDAEGRILDVSSTVMRLLGVARGTLVGRSFLELVDPEDRGEIAARLAAPATAGVVQARFSLASDTGGGRRLHLHARRIRPDAWLAVLHDYTRFAARDRSRRIMLDSMPRIASAVRADEVWSALWDAVHEMLPGATEIRVYRGDAAAVRLVWASDPGAREMNFTLRGWGREFIRMMQQPEYAEAFLAMFGDSRQEAEGRLQRFFSGRGNPLLLNDPNRQLGVFLAAEDIQKIVAARKGRDAPGQEILCPIFSGEAIDLVAVVMAAPGEKPFTWDNAADVWQLVQLAREVLVRIETGAAVRRHLEAVKAVRSMMRGVGLATSQEELFATVGEHARTVLGAPMALALDATPGDGGSWAVRWSVGVDGVRREKLAGALQELASGAANETAAIFVESTGGDEMLEARGLQVAGIEALAVVPLGFRGTVLGALALAWPAPRRLEPDERALFEFFGAELSLATMNHRLFQRATDAQAELGEIVRTAADGILSLDAGGRVRYCNPRAVDLLGIRAPAVDGRPLLDLLDEPSRRDMAPVLGAVLSGESVRERVVPLNDRRLRVTVSALGRREHSIGSVWTLSDLTREVVQSARLHQVFRHVSEPVLVLDGEGRLLDANEAGKRFLALAEGARGAGGWPETLSPELLDRLHREGTAQFGGRIDPGGRRAIPFEAQLWPVDEGGESRLVAFVRDLSKEEELRALKRELRETRRAMTQLAGLVANLQAALGTQEDLVTSILGQCQLALGSEDPARQRAALEVLQAVGERGRRGLLRLGEVAGEIADLLASEMERELGDEAGTRQVVWIVSDRPRRREEIREALDSRHLEGLTIQPEEVPHGLEYSPAPAWVVVDLVSLSRAEDVYRRFRRIQPSLPLVVVSPLRRMGGATEASEDPRLFVVEQFPAGRALDAFLETLAGR